MFSVGTASCYILMRLTARDLYTLGSKYRTYGPLSGNYTPSFGVCGMRSLKRMLLNSFTWNDVSRRLPSFTLFPLPAPIFRAVIKHRVFIPLCRYCYLPSKIPVKPVKPVFAEKRNYPRYKSSLFLSLSLGERVKESEKRKREREREKERERE